MTVRPPSYAGSAAAIERLDPGTALRQTSNYLEAKHAAIAKWVVGGVDPRALIRFALRDLSVNQKLMECSRDSIYLALLSCAITGLVPGAERGEAYLVPFKGKAQFMAGWRGLVKMARRSRDVKRISSNVVRENDAFDIELGSDARVTHKPLLIGERGAVIGAYAIAELSTGLEVEWMDRADLDQIERVATSRGASPAWKDWQDQMQRKAPIRRLSKRLPLGDDYYRAAELEQAADDGKDQGQILDVMTDGEATRAEASEAASAEIRAQAAAIDVP